MGFRAKCDNFFFEIVIFFSPEKIGHTLSLNVGLWDTICNHQYAIEMPLPFKGDMRRKFYNIKMVCA